MSTTDYVVDILLILVIFRQVRPRELTARSAILPIAIMAYAGAHYLRGFSVGGNDVLLISVFTVAGIALGTWSGLASRVWADGATVLAQAGAIAVATWILGMGFRFAFALYANSTGGDRAIGRFSIHHSITSGQVWTTALVLMAFGEVIARVGSMQWRRTQLVPALQAEPASG